MKSNFISYINQKFIQKRVPLIYSILLAAVFSLIFYWQFSRVVYAIDKKSSEKNIVYECPTATAYRNNFTGFLHIKPLLFTESNSENLNNPDLKQRVNQVIQNNIQKQIINTATVYIRNLDNGTWMSINENERYSPASLIKVPVLIVFLQEADKNPNFLRREIFFSPASKTNSPEQTYTQSGIKPGKWYTIDYLLKRMIIDSDNDATYLLNLNLNIPAFKRLFLDAGIAEPDVSNPNFEITANEYSRFMRLLYNASYLSNQNSDYALELLCKSDFKKGITKGIPDNIIVAHKFGESASGNRDNLTNQLHESGIFYCNNQTYLLTVMTKGKKIDLMPDVLAEISMEVYNTFK